MIYYKNDPLPEGYEEKPRVKVSRKSRLKRDCLEDPVFFTKVKEMSNFSIDVSATGVAFLALPLGGEQIVLYSLFLLN